MNTEETPTTFGKAAVKRLDEDNLIQFYWKVLNSLDQYATDEQFKAHDNNIAYLVQLLGYDPLVDPDLY
jgi:hypothetical protein